MSERLKLNPITIKEIAKRREQGMKIKDVCKEVGITPASYSKWKRKALDLLESHAEEKLSKLTTYQINLINFLILVDEAEERHAENVLKSYTDNKEEYKGKTYEEILSLAEKKVMKAYE
ncbi:transposase [Priestia aryabhattai]|uniref:transposase n=1 Tax=Priestia aryabhattai TaxID=412384 RepID=UPI002E1B2221|nr:transposase [Priestia aryabhattai]MED3921219.1 transposase [Priestia aryabhattai]